MRAFCYIAMAAFTLGLLGLVRLVPLSGAATVRPSAEAYTLRHMSSVLLVFFFNDTATTEIYTLSLHDALPICVRVRARGRNGRAAPPAAPASPPRSEEHTSELQSPKDLVCRLLLEKKKKI